LLLIIFLLYFSFARELLNRNLQQALEVEFDDKFAKKMIGLDPFNELLLDLERYLNKKVLSIKKRAPNTIIAIPVQMDFFIQFLRIDARPPLNPPNTLL
jgi:hypothetical protein